MLTNHSCLHSCADWKSSWRLRVIFSVFFTTSSCVGRTGGPSADDRPPLAQAADGRVASSWIGGGTVSVGVTPSMLSLCCPLVTNGLQFIHLRSQNELLLRRENNTTVAVVLNNISIRTGNNLILIVNFCKITD